MRSFVHLSVSWRYLVVAVFLAFSLFLLFPSKSEAHAILLRSDPAQNAVLPVAPDQVRMWFSEELNATLSTAVVVNEGQTHVDIGDAHVSPDDASEMDVDLKSSLPPAVYVVVYRAVSNDDGHVLTSSFLFTIARPDGSVPTLRPGSNPGANVLGSTSLSGQYTGQLDGPTFFNLVMITLVELGAVFYAGAAIWQLFVLQPASEGHEEERDTNQQTQQRFERRLVLPTLVILLVANVGVLIGQAFALTNGNWGAAFAPALLGTVISSGRFGVFWLVREIIILLALRLALYPIQLRKKSPQLNTILLWLNVILSQILFLTISLSSHAAATTPDKLIYALIADWLHLVAAAFWVGGMLYISMSYIPVLGKKERAIQARALTTTLPYYTPWALTGVIILAVTGPLNATVELSSWEQLFSTAYGWALVVKVFLVGGLLLTSAVHVFLLRPRLKKEYRKYAYASTRLQTAEKVLVGIQELPDMLGNSESYKTSETASFTPVSRRLVRQIKVRKARLTKRTRLLTQILRLEPVMGVAVLVCVGLMNVFAGTLSPIVAPTQTSSGPALGLHASARTSDGLFTVTLQISPGQVGSNAFLATIQETVTGKAVTNVAISLTLSDLTMDMGTQTVDLQTDGKGHFSGLGNFLMGGSGGHWQIRIQVRTPDNTFHTGFVTVQVS